MNNQLALSESLQMAEMFAKSGMFKDSTQAAQAFVKIQAGAELGITPFAAMSGIHIIQGKPTIGAGLMAGRLKSSGKYDYQVLQSDENICEIEFFQITPKQKSLGIQRFTKEEAAKAGTQNMAKFPKNMLFARCISNGVKFYCPDIFTGSVYVPEEIQEITEDIPHSEATPPALPKPAANKNAMKKAIDRIASGEQNIRKNMQSAFALTEEQDEDLRLAEVAKADENAA